MRTVSGIDVFHNRTWLARVLMGVALLLLTIQLLGAASHRHALSDNGADCTACHFTHHQPAGLPPATVAALPAAELVGIVLVSAGVPRLPARPAFLIPPAQAPPRRSV
jgi:hypothetical protein